jgi:hypothetical protein
MSRAIITIRTDHDRERAKHWIDGAPMEMRIEFKAAKRTLPQNDLMWGLLTDVASQIKHADRKYTTEQWKILFMHALGREVQFIPALDNSTFIPLGASSSDLSKAEMSELIDFIYAWGAQHSVNFHDEKKQVSNSADAFPSRDLTDAPAADGPQTAKAAGATYSGGLHD